MLLIPLRDTRRVQQMRTHQVCRGAERQKLPSYCRRVVSSFDLDGFFVVAADQPADEVDCIKVQESFAHLAWVLIATRVYYKWFLILLYCDSGMCCLTIGPAGRSQHVTVAQLWLYSPEGLCARRLCHSSCERGVSWPWAWALLKAAYRSVEDSS